MAKRRSPAFARARRLPILRRPLRLDCPERSPLSGVPRCFTTRLQVVLHAAVAVVAVALVSGPPRSKAAEAPENVPLNAVLERRSWGDTFMPTSPPPARRMQAVSLHGLPAEERIAVTCLQGLLARRQPRLFLVRNAAEDRFWMDWYVAKGHVDAFEPVADWKSLVREHRDVVKGVVVPDPALHRGDLLAANVAACEDLLVGSPRLAEQLGLPVVVDLRGRFTTYADGLAWLWATYKDRLNPHLCDFRFPGLLQHGTFDYAFQWRGLMLGIARPMALPPPLPD